MSFNTDFRTSISFSTSGASFFIVSIFSFFRLFIFSKSLLFIISYPPFISNFDNFSFNSSNFFSSFFNSLLFFSISILSLISSKISYKMSRYCFIFSSGHKNSFNISKFEISFSILLAKEEYSSSLNFCSSFLPIKFL